MSNYVPVHLQFTNTVHSPAWVNTYQFTYNSQILACTYMSNYVPVQVQFTNTVQGPIWVITRGGHAQLFFESATAILQLEASTSAIAIPQLFKKCCSATAIPQSQFLLKSATLNQQLESFTFAIFGIFLAMESDLFMNKKIGGKKSRATVPFRQVLFPGKQKALKIILVDF
jgi:hypothetical protein